MLGPENLGQQLTVSKARQIEKAKRGPLDDATYESDRLQYLKDIEEAETQGKVAIANEHWFCVFKKELVIQLVRDEIKEPSKFGNNPTVIPDDIFDTLIPVILIRHPAISVGSYYRSALANGSSRPGDEDFDMCIINRSLRMLFDWYKARGYQPAVVDGEDILWRTDEMAKNVGAKLGFDPASLQDEWEPAPKEEVEAMNFWVSIWTKDIHQSRGIIRPDEKVS